MNDEYREQYLMHYGVLGMKWGIRRKRDEQTSNKKSYKQKGQLNYEFKQYKSKFKQLNTIGS